MANGNGNAGAVAPVMALPFNAAAREHTERAFEVTLTPGATTQQMLQGAASALPSEGYLRSVYLEFAFEGGTGGTATGDAPWNIIQSLTLSDVNGAPIFGPVDGYSLYLINKYGGYVFAADPALQPDAILTTPNYVFSLRVPLEINRQTGFGSLANQNNAASYRLNMTMNPSSVVWSVAPAPMPTVTVTAYIETWTQPLPQDAAGRPQATRPPAHGTTQYWTIQTFNVNSGQQIINLTRVGNLIRSAFVILRVPATGVRLATAAMPDPIEVDWDARMYFQETLRYRRNFTAEAYINDVSTTEDGVLIYNWDRTLIGHAGGGSTALYLPTVQSTRLQFNCNFPAAATMYVLTNDIAPAEINPNMRYAESSATGFHPQVGTPIAGAGG